MNTLEYSSPEVRHYDIQPSSFDLGRIRRPPWRLICDLDVPSLVVGPGGHIVSTRPIGFDRGVSSQIVELAQLRDGWLDGDGRAPCADGLDWLRSVLVQQSSLDVPHLYPTAWGGVQAEWLIGAVDITLEIDLISHQGEWHELDMSSDDEAFEKVVHCDDQTDWDWIVARLEGIKSKRFVGG